MKTSRGVSMTLQDPRLRESLVVGATDCPLEDKMVTIAYGIDMVNISYISFAATTKAIAQVCLHVSISTRRLCAMLFTRLALMCIK